MPGDGSAPDEYLYSRTSTDLPVNVTVLPVGWPASLTSIVRLAGGSIRDPGASAKSGGGRSPATSRQSA